MGMVHFHFAFKHTMAVGGIFPHLFGDERLPFVVFQNVQFGSHEVVVGGGNFIDHHRHQGGDAEQPLGIMQVDDAHPCHHGSAVDQGETIAQV